MRTSVKRILQALSLSVALPVTLANATQAAAIKMVMNDYGSATQLKGESFEHLKAGIEKALGNKISIEAHHNGTLYSEKTEVQALQLNAIQLIAPTPAVFTNVFPKMNVLEMPFLFRKPEAVMAAVNDPLIQNLVLKEVSGKNIKIMGVWMHGPRHIAAKAGYLTPADIKGAKIRVQPAAIYIETFKAFGANPVAMSWGEVESALQQGIIDGLESPYNSFAANHIYEIAPHMSQIGYVLSFYLVATNKAWFDGLPADVQMLMTQAFDETTKWNWGAADEFNRKSKEQIAGGGGTIHVPNAEQLLQWVSAARPVWDKIALPLIGKEALNRLSQISEQYR